MSFARSVTRTWRWPNGSMHRWWARIEPPTRFGANSRRSSGSAMWTGRSSGWFAADDILGGGRRRDDRDGRLGRDLAPAPRFDAPDRWARRLDADDFAVQVLIVRYLSEDGFGAFAYALSIIAIGESIVTLGLDRAITRFVPIYEEHRQYDRLFGTIVLAFGTVIALGTALVLLVVGLQGWLAGSLVDNPQSVTILMILAVLRRSRRTTDS